MNRPTLYTYTLDVGRLRHEGMCFAAAPEGVVRAASDRFAETWLACGLRAVVTVREAGSRRVRPVLVQEVRP